MSSANVNLATETAVIWATSEAKVTRDWQQDLGQKLASHLTTCGFKSNLRGRLPFKSVSSCLFMSAHCSKYIIYFFERQLCLNCSLYLKRCTKLRELVIFCGESFVCHFLWRSGNVGEDT